MWSKSPDDPAKGFGDPTGRKYGAFPLLSSWDEYAINWDNQPQHDGVKFAISAVPPGLPSGWSNENIMWMDWDIRTIVTEWVNDRPNYGFVVKDLEESSPTLYATQFFTRNQVPSEDYFPRLELAYIPPSGIMAFVVLAIVWLAVTTYLTKTSGFRRERP